GSLDLVRTIMGSAAELELIAIREVTNTGFAAAANHGIRTATQPYVFLHNPDLVLNRDTLTRLVQAMERSPATVASVGPKLLRAGGNDLAATNALASTGIVMTRDGRHFDRGSGEPDRGQYDQLTDVFGITGAAVLFRRDALLATQIDGQIFDEDF